MERKLKPKILALLKPYLDSDQTEVTCDENPIPRAIDKQSHDTEKIDPQWNHWNDKYSFM